MKFKFFSYKKYFNPPLLHKGHLIVTPCTGALINKIPEKAVKGAFFLDRFFRIAPLKNIKVCYYSTFPAPLGTTTKLYFHFYNFNLVLIRVRSTVGRAATCKIWIG